MKSNDLITVGVSRAELLSELEKLLQECGSEGWDCYGASPINHTSYEAAERFIKSLPDRIPKPEVGVIPTNGEVSFDWQEGPRKVFTISLSESKITYASLLGVSSNNGSENYFGEKIPEIIIEGIKSVYD